MAKHRGGDEGGWGSPGPSPALQEQAPPVHEKAMNALTFWMGSSSDGSCPCVKTASLLLIFLPPHHCGLESHVSHEFGFLMG